MAAAPQRDQEFELRRYLTVLRRRKVAILLCALVTVALAVGLSATQPNVYEARGKVLLTSATSDELAPVFGNGTGDLADRVANEIQVMQSSRIKKAVAAELGHPYEVSITSIESTSVVEVTAEDEDADEVARIVNVFADTYLETRLASAVANLQDQVAETQSSLDELVLQAARIDQPVTALQDQIDGLPSTPPGEPASAARLALQEQRDQAEQVAAPKRTANLSQQLARQGELDDLKRALNLAQTSGSSVTEPATVPSSPVSPKPLRNGLIAGVIGLVLGMVVALLREQFDDALRTKEDLEDLTGGRPVLGIIPTVSGWRDHDQTQVVSISQPSSPVAEAYRTLRTSVQFLSVDLPVHKIQVTSPNQGDGKTTTVANLAVALARAGLRVAIVDCDLRRPRIGAFFGMDMSPGFTSVMLGDVSLADAIQQVPDEVRLSLLASGPPPPNPSELLSTKRARQVLDELARGFDVVLIDAPPVLPVTDSLLLSHMVDATVLVTSAGKTSRRSVRRAIELLEQVDANIEGSVLNAAADGESYGLGYGYGYGYDRSKEAGEGRERGRRSRKGRDEDVSVGDRDG